MTRTRRDPENRRALIEKTAERLLARDPDPVVRHRLLRDVLRALPGTPALAAARAALDDSRWVRELAREQRPDGSWGRFHSRDSTSAQRIGTTETGVERALALGLDAAHPVLEKAARYLMGILDGSIAFPDPPERNTRWPIGTRLFAAATLALLRPDDPILHGARGYWIGIARRSFASGTHDPVAELRAHRERSGLDIRELRYLDLGGKYQLALLGSRARALPTRLEAQLLDWICHRKNGIGYLSVPLSQWPVPVKAGRFERWLASHELLCRFPSWRDFARACIGWLWERRNDRGMWDFGPRAPHSRVLPLSESWRKTASRERDHTVRILTLLRQAVDPLS